MVEARDVMPPKKRPQIFDFGSKSRNNIGRAREKSNQPAGVVSDLAPRALGCSLRHRPSDGGQDDAPFYQWHHRGWSP